MRKMLDRFCKPRNIFLQFIVSFNALFAVVKITISARPGDNPCVFPHSLAFAPLHKLSSITDPRPSSLYLLKWALMQKLVYENVFIEIFVTRKIMCVHFSPWKTFRAVSTFHVPISQLPLNEPVHTCFKIDLALLRTVLCSFWAVLAQNSPAAFCFHHNVWKFVADGAGNLFKSYDKANVFFLFFLNRVLGAHLISQ